VLSAGDLEESIIQNRSDFKKVLFFMTMRQMYQTNIHIFHEQEVALSTLHSKHLVQILSAAIVPTGDNPAVIFSSEAWRSKILQKKSNGVNSIVRKYTTDYRLTATDCQ
jgi:hypothetical protein